ncbi:MAG: hypothetical protein ACKOXF_01035 [Chitinophagaceae bacterium]
MKILLSTALLVVFLPLNAYFNPKMRNNFGANHAILRLNAGYFNNVYQVSKPVLEGAKATAPVSMMDNMRLSAEAMVMLNNRYGFSESVSRSRPKFIHAKGIYDGIAKTTLLSAGYAHGLKCRAGFLFFGQVKGYFSLGAAALINNDMSLPAEQRATQMGARMGYNVYNRSSAFQFETYAFKSKMFVTAMAYKKLGENILIQGGVEQNQPKFGFSALIGSCRLSATTQLYKNNLQSGVNMTVNF